MCRPNERATGGGPVKEGRASDREETVIPRERFARYLNGAKIVE